MCGCTVNGYHMMPAAASKSLGAPTGAFRPKTFFAMELMRRIMPTPALGSNI